MKILRQVLLGFIVAFASLGLIIGSFSLSLAEGSMNAVQAPTQTVLPTDTVTLQPPAPTPAVPTPSPTSTYTRTPSLTPSLTPTPTICPLPAGWYYYIVLPGDTLDSIAEHYQVNSAELQQANCLETPELLPGSGIYVPPSPALPTWTRVPCGAPRGWVIYYVQPGDNLYRLSVSYGITVAYLQSANCMGGSTLLRVGQSLYVPPWAPNPPTPTLPWMVTPFDTPAYTPDGSTPTEIPTEPPTSQPTEIPSETPVTLTP